MNNMYEKPYKMTEDAKKRALDAVRRRGRVNAAAAAAGVSPETIRMYRKEDKEFAEEWEIQYAQFCAEMEEQIYRETVLEGEEVPIIGRVGKDEDGIITYVRKKSDRMRELFLKSHIPEFRDKQQVDMNVTGGVLVIPKQESQDPEELRKKFNAEAKQIPVASK